MKHKLVKYVRPTERVYKKKAKVLKDCRERRSASQFCGLTTESSWESTSYRLEWLAWHTPAAHMSCIKYHKCIIECSLKKKIKPNTFNIFLYFNYLRRMKLQGIQYYFHRGIDSKPIHTRCVTVRIILSIYMRIHPLRIMSSQLSPTI